MSLESIPLEKTGQFPDIFLNYLQETENLKPFYGRFPSLENFKPQIESKQFSQEKRKVLSDVLDEQMQPLALSDKQKTNLEALCLPNTYTITTGHQLCLATGPLYFIYKILSVIRLTEELIKAYPSCHFVPVFWMATEDHDLAEINHFHLFGKKIEWNTDQTGPSGTVTTNELREVLNGIPDLPDWLITSYSDSTSLAEATRKIVQYLFGKYGLLVIDGNEKKLKTHFSEIITKDLLDNKYAEIVRLTSEKLQKEGYKVQAHARKENFFYLDGTSRERIEKQGDFYRVLNTEIKFSPEELRNQIKEAPEKFSPNVILRPLYQELILPNLAYIGGPGELAYWLQLKDVFESENIPFPILFPRKFATIISRNIAEKTEAANLSFLDLFLPENQFQEVLHKKLFIEKFDTAEEEQLIALLKTTLISKAEKADKSLVPAIEAELSKTIKGVAELNKRLNKASENKHNTELNKLQNLRKKLFPENKLQERHDNFLTFYINNTQFIDQLYEKTDPFHFRMECIIL